MIFAAPKQLPDGQWEQRCYNDALHITGTGRTKDEACEALIVAIEWLDMPEETGP